jgi:hypothetical protein
MEPDRWKAPLRLVSQAVSLLVHHSRVFYQSVHVKIQEFENSKVQLTKSFIRQSWGYSETGFYSVITIGQNRPRVKKKKHKQSISYYKFPGKSEHLPLNIDSLWTLNSNTLWIRLPNTSKALLWSTAFKNSINTCSCFDISRYFHYSKSSINSSLNNAFLCFCYSYCCCRFGFFRFCWRL